MGLESDTLLAIYARQPLSVKRGIPIFSQPSIISENYDRIARDHLSATQRGIANPFMGESLWQSLEGSTLQLLKKYCANGNRILDVGVGLGRLLDGLDHCHRYGVDITVEYLELAKNRGIEVCVAEASDLPYHENFFDVIVCTDVLEHVFDVNAAIKSMLRVLKAHGILIIRVPDREDLSPYVEPHYPYRFAHLRNFDEPGLQLLFSRIFGCEFVETVYVHVCYDIKMRFPFPPVARHLITKALNLVLSPAAKMTSYIASQLYNPLELNVVFRKPVNDLQ